MAFTKGEIVLSLKGHDAGRLFCVLGTQDGFALIADGKSAREIGQTLFISEGTVKVHTHNIYQKLNISGRRQVYQLILEYQTGQRNA